MKMPGGSTLAESLVNLINFEWSKCPTVKILIAAHLTALIALLRSAPAKQDIRKILWLMNAGPQTPRPVWWGWGGEKRPRLRRRAPLGSAR